MITVSLTVEELRALARLMDAGVRGIGLAAVRPEVASVVQKMAAAEDEAQAAVSDG